MMWRACEKPQERQKAACVCAARGRECVRARRDLLCLVVAARSARQEVARGVAWRWLGNFHCIHTVCEPFKTL